MIAKIDENGVLVLEAETETESYALLQWWDGFYTKKNEIRKARTTAMQMIWIEAE